MDLTTTDRRRPRKYFPLWSEQWEEGFGDPCDSGREQRPGRLCHNQPPSLQVLSFRLVDYVNGQVFIQSWCSDHCKLSKKKKKFSQNDSLSSGNPKSCSGIRVWGLDLSTGYLNLCFLILLIYPAVFGSSARDRVFLSRLSWNRPNPLQSPATPKDKSAFSSPNRKPFWT